MNLSDREAAPRLSDWASFLRDVVVSDRPQAARKAADSQRRTVVILVGTTVVLTGILVAFTIQATNSYLPVFPSLVP